MAAFWYGNGLANAMKGNVDWESGTIKAALVTSAYTPNQDTHEFWSAVSGNEASGDGYTAGGQSITGKNISYDGPTNTVTMSGDNVVWPESTITARYVVVYQDTGTAGSSPLLGYADFGLDEASSQGTFQVSWNADGILTITAD